MIRRFVRATGIYDRLKWSPLHRLFISINNLSYEASQRMEMEFYRNLVSPGVLVFDVGANIGSKSEVFLRLGARVVAAEPDPECARVLKRRFSFSRRFHLVTKALGSVPGTLELFVERPGSAYNTLSQKWREKSHQIASKSVQVDVCTVEALIAEYGVPSFLKIDVEGFEREVLEGLQTAVPALSFEANLPTFRYETLMCIDKLTALSPVYRFKLIPDLSAGWRDLPWMSAAEAKQTVDGGEYGYCEVFALLTGK